MPALDRVLAHFQEQADICARLGSPFTAAVLEATMDLLAARDPALEPVVRFVGDPTAGALALRVAGALHRIARDGRDHRLAHLYARADESRARRAAALLSSTLRANRDRLETYLAHAPQTNEVARSAMLLGGLLTVAHAGRLPLAMLEIGASAGLNLLFDRYRYDFGYWSWGAQDAHLTIAADWAGSRPPEAKLIVAARLGCDRLPVDLRDDEARRRLRSYVWADQRDRIERLDQAIATALGDPPRVEEADTADWLEKQLAQPRLGRATVILHSIVWQYLGAEAQARITEAIVRRGATAGVEAPLAWLRLVAGRRGTSPRPRRLSRPAHDLARPAAGLIEVLNGTQEPRETHVRAGSSPRWRPDPDRRRPPAALRGEVPRPAQSTSGCEFHTRCPYAKERCRIARPLPQLRPPGQTVRCHFPLV